MRLALLSDIHGNPIALDAVLADISAQGYVDAYWVLGDMVALGFDPAGVLARLAQLPAAQYVRGNTDHYLVAEEAIQAMVDEAQAEGSLERLVPILRTLAWTQGAVTAAGWRDWVAALPVEQRLVLPDGTRLLGAHAAPGRFDGDGLHPGLAEDELSAPRQLRAAGSGWRRLRSCASPRQLRPRRGARRDRAHAPPGGCVHALLPAGAMPVGLYAILIPIGDEHVTLSS